MKRKQDNISREKLLDRMRRLCSRREYCSSDIRSKIVAALAASAADNGIGARDDAENIDAASLVEEVISSLTADRYIDDLRYATAFARDKASLAGWGDSKIRYALAAKKIDKETIAAALEEIDSTKASERLEKLLAAKLRSLKPSSCGHDGSPITGDMDDSMAQHQWQLRQKLLRLALSRGYSFDEASSAIDRLLANYGLRQPIGTT